MSKSYFYSHLIEMQSLIIELDSLQLSDKEKKHLSLLIDSNLHQAILHSILDELKNEEKKVFLEHLNNKEHDKIWKLLNEKIDNVEEKIKDAAEKIKEELKKDIKKAKRIKQ